MKNKQTRFIGYSFIIGLITILVLVMTACSSSSPTTTTSTTMTFSSIMIAPGGASVAVGSTVQLRAYGKYPTGAQDDITTEVTWTTSDANIVKISSIGVITGVAAGDATITATWSGLSTKAIPVTVIIPPTS